ncbi:FAD binding domain-containing protein [Nitrospirillum viridazoti]|uniref:Xanthine dehydrogenase YagS FAD-binding subunit n=3 Tax=Nitrospirillum TaxID=1543705 RepID=A0A560IEF9_9PROT|nr:xanthine dehydrogenase family protein subunit M [Nitrospirillum amazonense]TWB56685.1 xanthine dehydrogenase YagS FAD-binding subunit [Nitrospirillum amazonense]
MQPFLFDRAGSVAEALRAVPDATVIAGGTNLVDYMRLGVVSPKRVVDISGLSQETAALGRITLDHQGLRLGALVRMAEAEDHPGIRAHYPVLADSLALAASRQIRTMASLGGNLLQRTRCEYFREASWPCNKRRPGSGCAALDGLNRQHAVLGTSDACIATYPGDMAQALLVLDAQVELTGPGGVRLMPVAKVHRQLGATPYLETTLAPDELITALVVPASPWSWRSRYVKVRDRRSYAFALASAAVALDLEGDRVKQARIALGGVATVPWRAEAAEAALVGKPLDQTTARAAADAAFAGARTRAHNAFKVPLGQEVLVQALLQAGALQPPPSTTRNGVTHA